MLYIPHDQIGKVMRYVGPGGRRPASANWAARPGSTSRAGSRRAARQVAGELLHLYALRQATQGYGFSEDGEWQVRFEMAFPYEETEDQLRAIDAVKDDMESDQPMDRLICGDVGYGKTEVALRAAFKSSRWTASRSWCWCPPPSSPSSTTARSGSVSRSSRSRWR